MPCSPCHAGSSAKKRVCQFFKDGNCKKDKDGNCKKDKNCDFSQDFSAADSPNGGATERGRFRGKVPKGQVREASSSSRASSTDSRRGGPKRTPPEANNLICLNHMDGKCNTQRCFVRLCASLRGSIGAK